MSKNEQVVDPEFQELVELYVKARERERQLTRSYKEKKEHLDKILMEIQSRLLAKMNELGLSGVKTEHGTVTRMEKVQPVVVDWEAFWKYVLDAKRPDLLQKRVAARAVLEEMEEAGTALPGIKLNTEYVVRVRSNGSK